VLKLCKSNNFTLGTVNQQFLGLYLFLAYC